MKLIKTPQVFLKNKIILLHNKNKNYELTDDSKLMRDDPKEYKIKYLLDNGFNFKVTYREDIVNLKITLRKKIRVGLGYDIHRIQKIDNIS